jgi:hypothetical protein
MREMRNAYNIFVGKPGGKRPLGRYRRRWEGNIKINLKVTGWEGGLMLLATGTGCGLLWTR